MSIKFDTKRESEGFIAWVCGSCGANPAYLPRWQIEEFYRLWCQMRDRGVNP